MLNFVADLRLCTKWLNYTQDYHPSIYCKKFSYQGNFSELSFGQFDYIIKELRDDIDPFYVNVTSQNYFSPLDILPSANYLMIINMGENLISRVTRTYQKFPGMLAEVFSMTGIVFFILGIIYQLIRNYYVNYTFFPKLRTKINFNLLENTLKNDLEKIKIEYYIIYENPEREYEKNLKSFKNYFFAEYLFCLCKKQEHVMRYKLLENEIQNIFSFENLI